MAWSLNLVAVAPWPLCCNHINSQAVAPIQVHLAAPAPRQTALAAVLGHRMFLLAAVCLSKDPAVAADPSDTVTVRRTDTCRTERQVDRVLQSTVVLVVAQEEHRRPQDPLTLVLRGLVVPPALQAASMAGVVRLLSRVLFFLKRVV